VLRVDRPLLMLVRERDLKKAKFDMDDVGVVFDNVATTALRTKVNCLLYRHACSRLIIILSIVPGKLVL
jgi:hypothetical protein